MAIDQWTDEQETALLKAVVRWKPVGASVNNAGAMKSSDSRRIVGMHKHFRMLAIHDYMTAQGVVNPDHEHTKISGIWEKLASLYNLPILDEREDLIMNDIPDDDGNTIELYQPFELPESVYGDLMFAKRLKGPDDSESPEPDPSRRESTIADTDEAGSSPAPVKRGGRNARTPARRHRASKLQNEIEDSRRTSKATSVNEDENMDDATEDGDGVESDEEQEESGEDEDANKSKRRKVTQARGRGGRGSARRSGRKK